MKKLTILLVALLVVIGLTVQANATLSDIGGGMIYDDVYNIIWLQDANYAQTSGYDLDGLMTYDDAKTWADTLVYGGYDDWRLPTALNQDGTGPCDGFNCAGSEMGHLYFTELGNAENGPLTNTGLFINLQSYPYWSTTYDHASGTYEVVIGPGGGSLWFFDFSTSHQSTDLKGSSFYALAVRSVPEPSTLLLLGTGLVGIGLLRRRFKK